MCVSFSLRESIYLFQSINLYMSLYLFLFIHLSRYPFIYLALSISLSLSGFILHYFPAVSTVQLFPKTRCKFNHSDVKVKQTRPSHATRFSLSLVSFPFFLMRFHSLLSQPSFPFILTTSSTFPQPSIFLSLPPAPRAYLPLAYAGIGKQLLN